jgi:hypothetical protein
VIIAARHGEDNYSNGRSLSTVHGAFCWPVASLFAVSGIRAPISATSRSATVLPSVSVPGGGHRQDRRSPASGSFLGTHSRGGSTGFPALNAPSRKHGGSSVVDCDQPSAGERLDRYIETSVCSTAQRAIASRGILWNDRAETSR